MAHSLDEVLADVSAQGTLIDSLSTLLAGLKDQVTAAKGDQATIDQIFEAAEANRAKLVAAVTVNTPAESAGSTEPAAGEGVANPATSEV